MSDVIAIDWSGRQQGAAETIWLAHARDGKLLSLENGCDRAGVVEAAIALAGPEAVVGLDFAFSFPRWYCELEGWSAGRDVWAAMRDHGETLLARCEPPFWGRTGKQRQTLGDGHRATETGSSARSVFQIGGAGAVGTGSIRGMPHLLRFVEAGFAIWPFDAPSARNVVEIYPRDLTGKVNKSRHLERRAHLEKSFADQCAVLRERAAGSEDAFDAAVSAVVMAAHVGELARLPARTPAPIEGEIWRPGVS
jgi:hypothetical protein